MDLDQQAEQAQQKQAASIAGHLSQGQGLGQVQGGLGERGLGQGGGQGQGQGERGGQGQGLGQGQGQGQGQRDDPYNTGPLNQNTRNYSATHPPPMAHSIPPLCQGEMSRGVGEVL